MILLFHKLRYMLQLLFIVAALAWVIAPADMAAAESATAAQSVAPHMATATVAVAQHHHRAMTGCCGAPMHESCTVSDMLGCAAGAGAFLIADPVLPTDLADSPCAVFYRSAQAALTLASDPPPPRI